MSLKTQNKLENLIKILKKLRSSDGCDWDKEQTHESLIPYLLEETYEVIEAIQTKDYKLLKSKHGRNTVNLARTLKLSGFLYVTE